MCKDVKPELTNTFIANDVILNLFSLTYIRVKMEALEEHH